MIYEISRVITATTVSEDLAWKKEEAKPTKLVEGNELASNFVLSRMRLKRADI